MDGLAPIGWSSGQRSVPDRQTHLTAQSAAAVRTGREISEVVGTGWGAWRSGQVMEQDLSMVDLPAGDPLLGRRSVERSGSEAVEAADLDQLFREHRVRLTRLAFAITRDRTLAEEVVQDGFTGLHRRCADVESPVGYLQRSVVNSSIKVLRRRRTALMYRPDPAPLTHIPEIDETWDAVGRLPARQRAVVALRYWDDLSEAEIADALGWPTGTVKSTLHRALKRLKKEIKS